jgi:hypothetical protein
MMTEAASSADAGMADTFAGVLCVAGIALLTSLVVTNKRRRQDYTEV